MKVLQFGTGRFLRGFFGPIFMQSEDNLRVTMLQSRAVSQSGDAMRENIRGGVPVLVRGLRGEELVDTIQEISVYDEILRLGMEEDLPALLNVVCDPEMEWIVSNTTEAGMKLENDEPNSRKNFAMPMKSFPARLCYLLRCRFESGHSAPVVMPTELVEDNGEVLKGLVTEQARRWGEDDSFLTWLNTNVQWLTTLVDRMVVDVPSDHELANHPMAVMTEPYSLLAIKQPEKETPQTASVSEILDRADGVVTGVLWTDDLKPIALQKVRVLNGLHTAMVARGLPQGVQTVNQFMEDEQRSAWIRRLLDDEILPLIDGRVSDGTKYAEEVLTRFRNPFFRHRLADIAMAHATKLQTRLEPSRNEFIERFGSEPEILTAILRCDFGKID